VSEPLWEVIGKIDVAWRAEVVAGHEQRRQGTGALFGHVVPHGPREQHGVEAHASVGGRHHVGVALAPDLDYAIDGLGGEVGPVGEDDDCSRGSRRERAQAAAKRCSGTALPLGAVDDSRACIEGVRARHDDDVLDRTGIQPLENGVEEQALLRGAEARGGAGGEDDCVNVSDSRGGYAQR
jgi:hypothetical protein